MFVISTTCKSSVLLYKNEIQKPAERKYLKLFQLYYLNDQKKAAELSFSSKA